MYADLSYTQPGKVIKMSEQNPFNRFIDLINFDQKLHVHDIAIQQHQQKIEQLEERKAEIDTHFSSVRQQLHDAQKLVDEKELEMKDLEAQESDKKAAMDRVSNQKEYQSIKHELELIASKQLALEEVLVDAWNQLETTRKRVSESEKEYQSALQKIDEEIAKEKEALGNVRNVLQRESELRAEKESLVPEEWLEKYGRMRSQVEDPVVQVVDGSCSSCFHPVTGQDLILLNRNKLLQCKACYRFLYNKNLAQQVEG